MFLRTVNYFFDPYFSVLLLPPPTAPALAVWNQTCFEEITHGKTRIFKAVVA
jgi:hypothetical protein